MARIESDPNYTTPTFSRATAGTDPFKMGDVQLVASALSTHDHSTGKGLPLTVATGIPDGSITSAKILDGTIATADLAAHAISQVAQANGASSSPTTTSGSQVDMPDMSVTMTVTGGDVFVFFNGNFAHTTPSAICYISTRMDSGPDQYSVLTTMPYTANAVTQMGYLVYMGAPAAGSHTFRMRWSSNAGTLTAYATLRYMTVLELKR